MAPHSLTMTMIGASLFQAADYFISAQVLVQGKAVLLTLVWSGIVSLIAYKLVDLLVGLRVSEEGRAGLNINFHGESAYHS